MMQTTNVLSNVNSALMSQLGPMKGGHERLVFQALVVTIAIDAFRKGVVIVGLYWRNRVDGYAGAILLAEYGLQCVQVVLQLFMVDVGIFINLDLIHVRDKLTLLRRMHFALGVLRSMKCVVDTALSSFGVTSADKPLRSPNDLRLHEFSVIGPTYRVRC
ncbi:hypothetical protein Tco_0180841 [Tanacetum coccineum]